jgi:hypothetical protein
MRWLMDCTRLGQFSGGDVAKWASWHKPIGSSQTSLIGEWWRVVAVCTYSDGGVMGGWTLAGDTGDRRWSMRGCCEIRELGSSEGWGL